LEEIGQWANPGRWQRGSFSNRELPYHGMATGNNIMAWSQEIILHSKMSGILGKQS
jgi:hypothetical protein